MAVTTVSFCVHGVEIRPDKLGCFRGHTAEGSPTILHGWCGMKDTPQETPHKVVTKALFVDSAYFLIFPLEQSWRFGF
jgi:hypothetical protein